MAKGKKKAPTMTYVGGKTKRKDPLPAEIAKLMLGWKRPAPGRLT